MLCLIKKKSGVFVFKKKNFILNLYKMVDSSGGGFFLRFFVNEYWYCSDGALN